ncbi:MAG: glycogen/starch/alpha-glucan family phosphorylase [Acidobacteriota bacterium]|nr:glycogen/starch/alpha-glucan family phosphorylase [Acidobacteriota bacterium]
MKKHYSAEHIKARIEKILSNFGKDASDATKNEYYAATCLLVRDIMSNLRTQQNNSPDSYENKRVYYLSMEFLPGASLHNHIFNLGLEAPFREATISHGRKLEDLYEMDPDAGLGNGGLGRLASCYLDAIASQKMLGHGFSIFYEYGIFKQKIENFMQIEAPDDWATNREYWLIRKPEEMEEVHFGGKLKEECDKKGNVKLVHKDYARVLALPFDMLIPGYDSGIVNTLRLWKSGSAMSIDMKLFADGQYLKSMEEKHRAEVISKILYPEDAHREGKTLRLQQQYFFISASMQSLTREHFRRFNTLNNFYKKAAIHINDTHPAMAIPELMRIFMDDYDYSWEKAWEIVCRTISYTNHTIMPEALEQWPEDLFAELLPRIHSIVVEINRRFNDELSTNIPEHEQLRKTMSVIYDEKIRMANLCVLAAHKVNGVSALHSGIIRDNLFGGFNAVTPEKFTNVTNGIAYRRWLCQANPKLSNLIETLCGSGFKKDARELEKLMSYADNDEILQRISEVKKANKKRLAKYIKTHNNITVNLDSIFDVQVKRLHEYKRQTLNLIHIIDLYNAIKENRNVDIYPRTFIFGAKAAAGYSAAKRIISLACNLAEEINNDPIASDFIKVVFLENYSVSLSELIMPAADVSEQISLAGKEASGTGNMKLMINGAVTIGTEDGANIEIHEAVGDDNIFIFGMDVSEVEDLRRSGTYTPWSICRDNPSLERILFKLAAGINGTAFSDMANSLTTGYNGIADQYFVLADFEDYKRAQKDIQTAYMDKKRWNRMSLINTAKAGCFSADRAVMEYAENIWGIRPVEDI